MTLHIQNEQLYLFSTIHYYQHRESADLNKMGLNEAVSHFLFVASGKGTIEMDETIYSVESLQLYFLPEGTALQGMLFGHHIQYYIIGFQMISLSKQGNQWIGEQSAANSGLLLAGYIELQDNTSIHPEIKNLYETNLLPNNRTHSNLILQKLLLDIHNQRAIPTEIHSDSTPKWNGIEESIHYMQANLSKKMDRDSLAAIAKLTPSSYCRSFKKAKGVAPMDYLTHIRMEQAKLLLSTGITCKQVAYRLGYVSEYYFSRVFKKMTGLPPTIYMKRDHSRIAVASRFGIHLNLESLGIEPVVVIDCYHHPGIEQEDYNRRLMSQLEELKAAQPDLIIGDYSHASFSEPFKRIASTAFLNYDLDWVVPHRKIAELVGREKEAQKVIEDLDERIAQVKQRIKAMDAPPRVVVMQIMGDHFYLQGVNNHPLNKLLYTELGLLPGKHVPKHKMRMELYPTHLPDVEADQLWIRLYSDTADVMQTLQRMQEQPHWSNIAAVRNDQAHFINNWLIMSWTPQGRSQIVDEVMAYLKIV
ncbi:helix-turn-helix domain-containing protein [Cohnella abietis]|uniref:HTH-type transcriptional activator Btr n=1 Tax=Cohnella abietis TaxID=2507935 RepID=A0A3T1D6A1_9BACL|nr:AraC family transcriptional regulator [Cohnella abietis]BBI33589.1 HTH-type transcriptional activator Btr [Cohnella abietis]